MSENPGGGAAITGEKPGLAVTLAATVFGLGLLRGAPGTYGSIAAMSLAYLLAPLPLWVYLAVTLGITLLGVWAAGRYCAATGRHDNQHVVIDEVAGYLVTVALGPKTPLGLLLGLGLFRLFDIWKPWPVRVLDRRVKGGLGVVLDDLAAGVLGAAAFACVLKLPLSALGVW